MEKLRYIFTTIMFMGFISPSFSQELVRFGYYGKSGKGGTDDKRQEYYTKVVDSTNIFTRGKAIRAVIDTVTIPNRKIRTYHDFFWGSGSQEQNQSLQLGGQDFGGVYSEVIADNFGIARVALALSVTNTKGDSLQSAELKDIRSYFNGGGGNAILKLHQPLVYGAINKRISEQNWAIFLAPRLGFQIPSFGVSSELHANADFGLEGQVYIQGASNDIALFGKMRAAYTTGNFYSKTLKNEQLPRDFWYGVFNFGILVQNKYAINFVIPIKQMVSSNVLSEVLKPNISMAFKFDK